jgi:hypothetical protein
MKKNRLSSTQMLPLPQSLNKYQYCFNNPLRYVDLDGRDGVTIDSDTAKRLMQGAAIAVGPTLTDGIHRARYEQAARQASSKSMRNLLKADTRDNMSTFSKELSKTRRIASRSRIKTYCRKRTQNQSSLE